MLIKPKKRRYRGRRAMYQELLVDQLERFYLTNSL